MYSVVSQFARWLWAEFQNTVATANRNGIASSAYGMRSSERIACPARLTADMREDHWATELIIMMLHRLQRTGARFCGSAARPGAPPGRAALREGRSINARA